MKMTILASVVLAGVALSAAGCDLDVPDLNNPGLDDLLENNPTRDAANAACTGLLIGNRFNQAVEFGYVNELGILGRESYDFTGADPRFFGELLGGELSQGSPFGGNFWAGPYANIRLANLTLHALDKINPELLADDDKTAMRGFIHTIMAVDLLQVIVTHDTNGAVIDTDRPVGDLGAIVDKDTTYAEIKRLLDTGLGELKASLPAMDPDKKAFTFLLSPGFDGFNTPLTFQKFNRAIRARVAVYTKEYADALTALADSFLDDSAMAKFDLGVYYTYSTKSGDTKNGLLAPSIYVHPSVKANAMAKGTMVDARYTSKVTQVKDLVKDTKSANGPTEGVKLTSSNVFTIYPDPDSSVALIRNEELILLKAEALFFKTPRDAIGAYAALNLVRTGSGKLDPLPVSIDATKFTTDLLYERRYSLLFEGGHRWIDVRRFDRVNDLPLDDPKFVRNVRFPFPLPECNARPGEPRCSLGST